MRIDPDMRNTIWPYRGIAHLLSDTWPAVSICTRIDPAFNSFRNKNAISTRPQLHPQCRRMAVERQPFLVAAQHNLHRPACLARKASDNRFNPHKGFCAESPSHRWTDNAHLVVRDVKDAGQIRTQVERGLRTCPDLSLPLSPRATEACGSIGACWALAVRYVSSTITSACLKPSSSPCRIRKR